MKKLRIIKAGTTFSSTLAAFGDFEDWILAGLGKAALPIEVFDVTKGVSLPRTADCLGIIVTGSHAMVTEELPWSLGIERWIPDLVGSETPFLGICYGHQLLGRAMGGQVGYHPLGRELGTVEIRLEPDADGDPLFAGIPERFLGHSAHSQSVLLLPPGAKLLASGVHEPHMSFRIGKAAWGVQFHPEYTAAVMNADVSEDANNAGCRNEGCNGSVETPFAAMVLSNFAGIVSRRLADSAG
ncbi:MAG: glutamine amidotransferase [Chlorobiaceae bacterium]|nr:glutamine amidotransferase [Chlorobiaceae bacterium]NTV60866.1 glutamine amidotransferase [Chlorobiaceae bacterium]